MNGLETKRMSTRALLWLVLILMTVLYAYPFAYMLFTSFKTPLETNAIPPTFFPTTWTIENYVSTLTNSAVPVSILNSIQTAVISTLLSLALAIPAAYAVTRWKTRLGRVFILTALVMRMVPAIVVGAPLIGFFHALGLSDTSLALAIAQTTISLPLSIWLMASFFDAVPDELEEAARVDGTSRLGALWRVVLPVARGGVAVTAIFAFLASWNDFIFALLLTSVRAVTTPLEIANYQSQFGLAWGPMTSLAVLYSVPVILLTLVLQRHIVAGLTLGAVKG
ncbi:carbohydrate ABC transporter permease [Galbitalea soli]|uniref:Carbohydrate ABC transporter permease n=1 Tax=Galbitalea soli TaxID=1268042 RepID=A0A7C9TQS7_9MICO|nr:carbohydrate ABC transporter permease [Galbitalea soli]NEM91121.1 carbohydrate ABC transporter permease [Galbitalea soli]NYJ29810.1 multiple sugar transport system permease protein [Galbitalea soli]